MKIEVVPLPPAPPPFDPVVITLTSQAEVDALSIIARHVWITTALPALHPLYDGLMSLAANDIDAFTNFDRELSKKYAEFRKRHGA